MREARTGKLLRVFVDEGDRFGDKPLYAAIVDALRAAGFGGATVQRGIAGYGIHRTVHAARTFDVVADLPMLVEAIDEEAKVLSFLPALEKMVPEGLITLEDVTLMRVVPDKGR